MEYTKRMDLNISYNQKNIAKKYGAKWDSDKKTWYLKETISNIYESLNKISEEIKDDILCLIKDEKDQFLINDYINDNNLSPKYYFKKINYDLSDDFHKRESLFLEFINHFLYYKEDIEFLNKKENLNEDNKNCIKDCIEYFDELLSLIQQIKNSDDIIEVNNEKYWIININEDYIGIGSLNDYHINKNIQKYAKELNIDYGDYSVGSIFAINQNDYKLYNINFLQINENIKLEKIYRERICTDYIDEEWYYGNENELDEISLNIKQKYLPEELLKQKEMIRY